MRIYKLFSTATVATNAASFLTIQQSGRIVFLSSLICVAVTGLGQGIGHEVSFAAVAQSSANDSVGPILENRANITGLTTGAGPGGNYVDQAGISIPVTRGDRLYINAFALGTAPGSFATHTVFVHVA